MSSESIIYPCATIYNVGEYLNALRIVVKKNPDWKLCENKYPEINAVLAKYRGNKFDGEDLRICVCERHFAKTLVDFALTAHKWPGQHGHYMQITDAQINNAFKLFKPITRNAAVIAGIKLAIKFAKPRKYKLPRKTKELIKRFVALANLEVLHPLDWGRFYDIIHHAHRHNTKMTSKDLAKELIARKVPKNMVEELVSLYGFGRILLSHKFSLN